MTVSMCRDRCGRKSRRLKNENVGAGVRVERGRGGGKKGTLSRGEDGCARRGDEGRKEGTRAERCDRAPPTDVVALRRKLRTKHYFHPGSRLFVSFLTPRLPLFPVKDRARPAAQGSTGP